MYSCTILQNKLYPGTQKKQISLSGPSHKGGQRALVIYEVTATHSNQSPLIFL